MSFSLLDIAKQGVLAHQQSLNIVGKNINNTNTPSYVRERTEYVESSLGGLERVRVQRMIDEFSNRQLRTDISKVSFYEANLQQAEQLDTLLGDSTTNVASSIEKFFNTLQDANNDPGSVTARQLVIADAGAMVTKFNDFSQYLDDQEQIINDRMRLTTDRINALAENINELNRRVSTASARNNDNGDLNALMNQRDEELRKLAELIEFSTIENKNGTISVNLKSGQPLVLENNEFNALTMRNNPDTERLELVLQKEFASSGGEATFLVPNDQVGGSLGGYLDYRDDILMTAQRRLGQLAVRIADAVNEQNQRGMDLDNQLGVKLFDLSLTEAAGLANDDNAGTATINARILEGNSESFPSENLRITMTSATQFEVVPVDSNGQPIAGAAVVTGDVGAAPGTDDLAELGLQIDVSAGAVAGDSYIIKPAESAASEVRFTARRPEDIALANPIRVISDINNQGSAAFEISQINNPGAFYDTTNNTLDAAAPARIEITGQTGNAYDLELFDVAGNSLGTLTGATDLRNIVTQIVGGTPDYDVTIRGEPAVGDEFRIEYNTNGFDDNTNGQALADLQRQNLVRRDGAEADDPTMTFNESYARLVSDVGSLVSQNRVLRDSAIAIRDQTRALYESQSGVNLDEEAANLIQFQQAYSASARIMSTAQTIFETLLNAVR